MLYLRLLSNDHHAIHIDDFFGTEKFRHFEKLASLLGSNEMSFVSQGDKDHATIRLTGAKLQRPLLVHIKYRVSLSNHDWV